MQELKISESSHFITLTYSDENLPIFNCTDGVMVSGDSLLSNIDIETVSPFETKTIQNFIKRLRKENNKHTKAQIRYYLVGEKGEKFKRPHYHAIMFNIHPKTLVKLDMIWALGFVKIGDVNQASIHYCTKYMLNIGEERYCLMSRRPFLGSNYLNGKSKQYHRNTEPNKVHFESNKSTQMPRIFKEKIFSKPERENLGLKQKQEKIENDRKDMKKIGEELWIKTRSNIIKTKTKNAIKQSKTKDL